MVYTIPLGSVGCLYPVHRLVLRKKLVLEAGSLVLGENMLSHLLSWVQQKDYVYVNQTAYEKSSSFIP
jgi:hypothetical protein